MSFLTLLRDDIRAGLRHADALYCEKHARWIAAQQRPEGGFANRRGKADLYYTAFALRSLSALEKLSPEIATSAAGFLAGLLRQPEGARIKQPGGAFCDAVMAASWWDSMLLCEEVIGPQLSQKERAEAADVTHARLNTLRRGDGGWAKTDVDAAGSLYHTFLAACVYLRMTREMPEPEKAHAFAQSLAQPGGGFLENKYSKRPGTNGSAAGIFLTLPLAQPGTLEPHAAFFADMQGGEGGFHAMPAAPIADLLSTYTGLLALKLLGRGDPRRVERAVRYARSLEAPGGGYAGFALESVVDCEYTFYGLGVESVGF